LFFFHTNLALSDDFAVSTLESKKKGDPAAAFLKSNLKKSGAGWRIVVIASSDNDTADDSSSSQESDDYASSASSFAFFLGVRAYALYLGSANCLCSWRKGFSHYWRAYKRSGRDGGERDLTETHYCAPYL
jgi:hypothetical protein